MSAKRRPLWADAVCDGGTLRCECGGDLCVCGTDGMQCVGCPECEGDDDIGFEDFDDVSEGGAPHG